MKKRISCVSFSLLIVLFFAGCQKQIDTPDVPSKPGEEVAGTPLPGQATYCRIESIWGQNVFSPGQMVSVLVLWDEYENPVAITTPFVGTGSPYRTFHYDQWHRLREFRGAYSNGGFEFWHFYGYDQNGRIGVDTQYVFASISPTGTLQSLQRYTHHIQYDAQGRIMEVISEALFGGGFQATYDYDAAGNLIYPGQEVVYDNKINFNRSNDIWQFLSRDYSVNNPFTATAYNAAGFPTIIPATPAISWSSEFQRYVPMQVAYGCR